MAFDPDPTVAEALYGLVSALVRRSPRDMSLTAVATLATLERTSPRRITELALVENVAQPSMTSLISNLERQGLVERRSDPSDRRVALVSITNAGVEYLRCRRRLGAEAVDTLTAKLTKSELAALETAKLALLALRRLDDAERDPSS